MVEWCVALDSNQKGHVSNAIHKCVFFGIVRNYSKIIRYYNAILAFVKINAFIISTNDFSFKNIKQTFFVEKVKIIIRSHKSLILALFVKIHVNAFYYRHT